MKIETIGIYLNFILSLVGTMGLWGLSPIVNAQTLTTWMMIELKSALHPIDIH